MKSVNYSIGSAFREESAREGAGSRRCQWQMKAGAGPMRQRVQEADGGFLRDYAEL